MMRTLRDAVFAVGFAAAFAALPVRAAAPVQSFAAQPVSLYESSASGLTDFAQPVAGFGAVSPVLHATYGNGASGFAGSTLLAPNLALDVGRNLDIAARFDNYDGLASPLLSAVTAPFLSLANGGQYAGFTYTPTQQLRLRLGTALNSESLDGFTVDPFSASGDLPLSYHASLTQSLIAGVSWDLSESAGIGLSAISSSRNGVPLGLAGGLPDRSTTDAIGVSAHLGLGGGWVTKLSYSEGLSQLDLRSGQASTDERSYSIAVAKRGLFGDDAMGIAFSQPAPGLTDSFASLPSTGELPPMIIARGESLRPQAPETDFQLGYVTNFLDGALALQANASYQMNYQGQTGATAVSLLSRAKIKF